MWCTSLRKTLDSDEKDWLRAGDLKKECLAHNQNAFGFFVYCKLLVLKEVVGANGFEPSTSWSRTRRASQAALRPDRQAELSASHFASRLAQLSTHSYTRLVPCLGRGVLFAQSLRFAG